MAIFLAYIDKNYFDNIFGGEPFDEAEFALLARAASDLCDAVVTAPITAVTDNIRRAGCYEVELLHRQGGVEAYTGLAISTPGIVEKAGDLTFSNSPYSANSARGLSFGGLPVSPIAYALLRAEGLTCRAVSCGSRP
jgi:hypothetical protein